MDATGYGLTSRWQWDKHIPHVKKTYRIWMRLEMAYHRVDNGKSTFHILYKNHTRYGCDWIWLNMVLSIGNALHSTLVQPSKNMFFAMVGLAFTMGKPHPYRCQIIKMINSCCVHNGERFWCDFSGPVVGGVPCGKGDGSKDGGTSGFRCIYF